MKSRPATRTQRGCGTLFLAFFLLIGGFFVVVMLAAAYKTAATYGWQQAECEILSAEGRVRKHARAEEPPFEFVPRYRYTWKGGEHISERLSQADPRFSDWSKVRRLLQKYPPGARVACYFDPEAPSQAILERRGLWMLLFLPLPLLFVFIGGGGIYTLWFGGEKTKNRIQALSEGSRVRKHWIGPVLFAIFALVGLGVFVGVFLPSALRTIDSQRWAAVPCRIEFSRVGVHRGDKSTTYSVDLLYSYETGGRLYRSSRYRHFDFSSSGYGAKKNLVKSLPRGTETTCYVDPADPANAVLDRAPSLGLLFGLLPLTFFLVGLFGLRHQLRKRSRRTVGGIPAPQFHGGPLVLEPKVGKWGKFAGMLLFGGFWNGIVGVFLYQVIDGWRRGRPEWFLAVFLTPFVLVGLATIAGVFYYLLALLNPRPRLTLSPGVVQPGSASALTWELRGNTSAVRRLGITFEGHEEVTVRRGKNTSVRRHKIHEANIFDSGEAMMTHRGSASVKAPRDAMHSFEAGGAKVVWTLHVEGDVARWPDIDVEFPVQVFPSSSFGGSAMEESAANPPPVRAGGLSLQLARPAYAPGGTVDGTAEWDLEAAPESLAVRLFWYLGRPSSESAEVVSEQRIESAGERGRRAFRLDLPPAPHSYQGELFSIDWAVELVAKKPDRVARAALTVR